MIRGLKLERWRAFDALDVTFGEGLTFVVAPNGVGKTSLLLGLTWAVFGDHAAVDPAQCIRLGYDSATVTATISGDGKEIQCRRTVTTSGRRTHEYLIDGVLVDDVAGEHALETCLGVTLSTAAKLAIIRSAGEEPLDLDDHLFHAFGVTDLLQAITAAADVHRAAVKARKAHRDDARARLHDRQLLEDQAAQLREELSNRADERAVLSARLVGLQQDRRTVSEWERYTSQREQHDHRVAAFLQRVHPDAGVPADLVAAIAHLDERISRGRELHAEATEDLAAARAREIAARSALELLHGQQGECPTCARPFGAAERAAAVEAQHAAEEAARTTAQAARDRLAKIEAALEATRELSAEGDRLRDGPVPPARPKPTSNHEQLIREAEQALRVHDEETGSLTNELLTITGRLEDDDAARAAEAREVQLWRREAVAQAALSSLKASAARIANEHLTPLSDQVRWRWKALFGEDGLQLRADGSIVRVIGDRELPWVQLSGGERIWARIVAGLLVLQASSALDFACIDEPLEHLDPRTRRIVAADIAAIPGRGRPRQLIVTTYEHSIARQIATDSDNASVLIIRDTQVANPSPTVF